MKTIYLAIERILPFAWLEPSFMKNAFLAVLAACPLFGALGTNVVSNRMSFFSDAIGHSALTGIAIGVMLGSRDVMLSMILFSAILGFSIVSVKIKAAASADTIIGVFSSTAVALGIVLLSSGGNFSRYQNFLVGDILSIQPAEILTLVISETVLLAAWIFFYNKMLLTSVNATVARSRGIRTFMIEQIFALLIAVIVTLCIRWTGLLVINSLLVLPAAAARMVSKNSRRHILNSACISLASGIIGLAISFYADSASGASIVLVNAAAFILCLAFSALRKSK